MESFVILTIVYLFGSAIVSFTNVSSAHKKEAEELGVSCFSWEEFYQSVRYVLLSTPIHCLINKCSSISNFCSFCFRVA